MREGRGGAERDHRENELLDGMVCVCECVSFISMGFGDKEIVALSGAHTIGRARTVHTQHNRHKGRMTKM